MKFNNINKEIIAGVCAALAACLLITSIPFEFTGTPMEDTEISNIQASAGANSSMNNSDDSLSAGANGVLGGTVGVVGGDNNTVGQPSDDTDNDTENGTENDTTESEKPVYKDYGYTNLGLADVEGNLNIRKKASTSASVVGKLTKYAACEVLEEKDGWYKIKSGKVEGWVSASYIITGEEAYKIAQNEASLVATVTTSSLRVRKAPSTDSKKLSNIAKGEEVYVEEIVDGWAKIIFDGYDEAYVSLDYVKIEEKLKTAQTMDEIRYGQISQTRIDLVNYALQFVGNKYVWGGNSLTKGVDCSGFTKQIYKKFGITLPRTSRTQPSAGKKIKSSEAQPGDLFFYGDSDGINHVAIYIGNGKIVHAANKKDGIKISNAYYRKPKCVVTYFND